ncbi:glycosyltransferase [Halomicroarcula sp. F28]|uniref:glucosyl-dolichyl phosphate glucuronosyltransferase n=1 Tax=Haloarcula salinisoli TaxID=2487746 RepID=UPI001C732AB7|nr:glucosyl-dolichyl phosphate glucuronosyltransferase [Halomicroarcula salinisoli]MBX0285490.1 glycosyltransferase [Halomicroarcula salinisoli]
MRVSVVLCTHTLERYDDCCEAAESVLGQSHEDVELVLVSDGNDELYEQFQADFGDNDDVLCTRTEENVGLAAARNAGTAIATGDIFAFFDDDAIADRDWLAELVSVYEQRDVPAAGGRMVPYWVAGKPTFLPEEFYWLVGVTHQGFGPNGDPDEAGEVRNTFGSNISFRREVYETLGGFEPEIGGRTGEKNLQAEEPELCARMQSEFGHGVYYTPEAKVAHKVFDYRTDPGWLLDRAFWQGYSKRGMEVLVPESTGDESDFLRQLLFDSVPDRVGDLVKSPSVAAALQLFTLFVLTGCVGAGYLYGVSVWG